MSAFGRFCCKSRRLLTDLSAKQLEMLKEVLPQAKRIGVLWNPTTPSHMPALKAVEVAGDKLGLQLTFVLTRTPEDFDTAMATIARENISGILVLASPATYGEQGAYLAALALKYRLPGLFGFKENVHSMTSWW